MESGRRTRSLPSNRGTQQDGSEFVVSSGFQKDLQCIGPMLEHSFEMLWSRRCLLNIGLVNEGHIYLVYTH